MLTDEQIQKAGERFFWSFDEDAALFARAIEAAACAERDARIVEFERQLEEARKVLKETGLLLHHFWCDVPMNEYSFEKLNKGMEAIDAAMKGTP